MFYSPQASARYAFIYVEKKNWNENQQAEDVDEAELPVTFVLRGGSVVGRWTCDLQVVGSIPGRSAFT